MDNLAGTEPLPTAKYQSIQLTLDQYTDKVVRPIVVEQKLKKAFEDSINDEGKAYEVEQIRASHILFPPKIESGGQFPKLKRLPEAKPKVLNRLRMVKILPRWLANTGLMAPKMSVVIWAGLAKAEWCRNSNAIWALPTDTLAPEP